MSVRKQSLSHEQFLHIAGQATKLVSRQRIERLISKCADAVTLATRGKNAAYAWSGGKDSVALRLVCEAAGVTECVLGISNLEYPEFLCWVTERMPDRLTVINTGPDLEWLASHPEMLFPREASIAAQWFSLVQHRAQREYYRANSLDVILLGRRRSDGNFVGKGGANIYTSEGVTRMSPIADWSHTEVFAAIEYFGAELPPFYRWPRGYRCGTHAWAARQWCETEAQGWSEVCQIDPSIVSLAASWIEGAKRHVHSCQMAHTMS
jgi:3'-phosphoadenosine 5'-phosphosulfate sulfotransferase (PAPS reductase)/FAD synthetase